MENLPAEAISHRERRRRLFAKGWGEVTSPAGSISHRDCGRRMSEGRETDDDEEEDEVEPRMEEQNKADPDVNVIQMDESSWMTVSEYRRQWNDLWSGYYGSSEDTSSLLLLLFGHWRWVWWRRNPKSELLVMFKLRPIVWE
ncbi:hypothetical protein SETIT_2G400900v2 [Setaria italica]|uniref:Uncharacterized protein n=1 Tax=Setaria italica TaxID=4555 RepID=A0A368Q8H5_SETIT|nr:hypothetical protein SETIT_2G400900v2 [Setaria italica]